MMVSADAIRIEDADRDAPWLVLVHGFSQDHRAFSAQVPAFRDRYRLLLIDLPGHGLSSELAGPYGHGELAAAVAACLADHDVGACHYWATHTGTAVGLLLACQHGVCFHSLILEGVVLPGRTMESVARMFDETRQVAVTQGLEAARQHWFASAAWFAVMRARPDQCRAREQVAMISRFAGRPWLEPGTPAALDIGDDLLSRIDAPILIYNGEHDLVDFHDAAAHLSALLPMAEKRTIADAGGFPGWEFPATVNAEVAAFLRRTEQRGGCRA